MELRQDTFTEKRKQSSMWSGNQQNRRKYLKKMAADKRSISRISKQTQQNQ